MRTLIDIPEEDLVLLRQISKAEGVSRAELVRRAISASLAPRRRAPLTEAFGIWKDSPVDGLAYQERLREEWEERFSTQIS